MFPAGISTTAQFYQLMEQSGEIPKTAQINPFEFQELYLQEVQGRLYPD